jgi:hypothetical protein
MFSATRFPFLHHLAVKREDGMEIRRTLGTLVVLLALLAVTPALAVDGVIEINQARVLAGGITATDNPGFPVTIGESGSYRLTGDLTVPSGAQAFFIESDNVTLDLNGFTLFGGGGLLADGIGIGNTKNVEIRNGTIRGFSRAGIFANAFTFFARVINVRAISNAGQGIELQGQGNLVDGCTAASNGTSGIRVMDGGMVTRSVMRANGTYGLLVTNLSAYGGNVLTGNNGGDANPQVAGLGVQISLNMCGTDTTCP